MVCCTQEAKINHRTVNSAASRSLVHSAGSRLHRAHTNAPGKCCWNMLCLSKHASSCCTESPQPHKSHFPATLLLVQGMFCSSPCLHCPHFSDPSALPIRAAASSVPPWCSHPPLEHLCQPLLGREARALPEEPPWTRSKPTGGQPVHEQLQTFSPGRTEQPLRDQV